MPAGTSPIDLAPPPGVPLDCVVDFDVYSPPGIESDYHGSWKALQRPGGPDLVWTPRNGGHWIAVRGKAIATILEDYANFSSRSAVVPREDGVKTAMIPSQVDLPAYAPYRSIMMRALSPKRILHYERQIRDLAVSLIEDVRAEGHCDFVTHYAENLPIAIFLNMCDLPFSDAKQLKLMADRRHHPNDDMSRLEVGQWFSDYLAPVVRARRGSDAEDIISIFANATIEGKLLPDDEVIQMSTVLMFAGLDTVVHFLSFAMLFLATNPAHRDALIADPELINPATEELLRRFAIVMHGRLSTRDQIFAGVPIRKDEMVILPTALHGLDESENADPFVVDFGRTDIRHSTFGQGAHRCIGLLLAKTEIRITLQEWTSRIGKFRLAEGANPRFGSGMVGTVSELPLVWDLPRD